MLYVAVEVCFPFFHLCEFVPRSADFISSIYDEHADSLAKNELLLYVYAYIMHT